MRYNIILLLLVLQLVLQAVDAVAYNPTYNPNQWQYYAQKLSCMYTLIQPSERDDYKYTFAAVKIIGEYYFDGYNETATVDLTTQAWGRTTSQPIFINNKLYYPGVVYDNVATPVVVKAWYYSERLFNNRVDVINEVRQIKITSKGILLKEIIELKLYKATGNFNARFIVGFNCWNPTYKEVNISGGLLYFDDNPEDNSSWLPSGSTVSLNRFLGTSSVEVRVNVDWMHKSGEIYNAVLKLKARIWLSDAVATPIPDYEICIGCDSGWWVGPPGSYTNITFPSWDLELPEQIERWKGWLATLLILLVIALANQATAPYFAVASAVLLGVFKASGWLDPPDLVVGLLLAAGGLGIVVSRGKGA